MQEDSGRTFQQCVLNILNVIKRLTFEGIDCYNQRVEVYKELKRPVEIQGVLLCRKKVLQDGKKTNRKTETFCRGISD